MNFLRSGNRVSRFKDKLKIDVNYFRNRRWQLVALLEQLTGVWPYQGRQRQCSLQAFHFVALSSVFLAVANKTREFVEDADMEMIVECAMMLLFLLVLKIKLFLASALQKTRKRIYERIRKHFDVMTDPAEAFILAEHADRDFKYTAIYVGIGCTAVGIFDIVPIARSLYNYFVLHDELNVQLPVQMDYGFDHKRYWYVILLDFSMFVCAGILVDVAFDLSFILQVRHVQALFKVVGVRLKKASDELENDARGDESYSMMSSAVELHAECFEIVKMMEETYTGNWFVVLLLNTAVLGVFIHMISAKIDDPIESFRFCCAFVLITSHYLVIFSQGQIIIDSSSAVSEACYNCSWYTLPKKSRKLMSMMMMVMPASTSSLLTGGKLFPLSMESFGKMLKAGLSYYTVFEN